MLFYLLLTIFFGLVVLIASGTFIFGLLKKRKNVLVIGAVLFAAGLLGGAFSGLAYSKKVYDYVKSKDFQEDAKNGSAFAGRTVGSVSSGLSQGLLTTLDDDAIAGLAKKSATILGKSIKTMASGFDSTIGNKTIFIDQNLAAADIVPGRATERYDSMTTSVGIFIHYNKDFTGKARLTNYDQTGKKIDVAEKEITAKAEQEKVEVFRFTYADAGLTTYYILSKAE